MYLLSIDDFVLADHGIAPALITDKSSSLTFGVDRRSGLFGSVFFGSSASPASWHAIIQCPDEATRDALTAVLAAIHEDQVQLLAQRGDDDVEQVTTWAAVSSVRPHGSSDNVEVTFESNDSIWISQDVETVSKTFSSALDQILHLPAPGNVPTQPVIRLTPTGQRTTFTPAVGWKYRQRWMIANNGDEPLFRYEVRIPLGDTTGLVSGSKALASGADLHVWLHGLEQPRTLVGWNSSNTGVWVVVPALPPGEALTYEIVYGNPLAVAGEVDLVAPDLPAHDISVGTNYQHRYRTATARGNAGEGLWPLSSPLEGGSADHGAPGAWEKALTFANPNNSDRYVQPSAQRLEDAAGAWYQARLYAQRWRGEGFDNFDAYAGSDPYDGVVLHNPFGVRAVRCDGIRYRSDAYEKTTVSTTVGDTTETSEVLTPHDPPFTRVVAIGRNSGGENWHVLQEYAESTIEPLHRLYLQGVTAAPISPAAAAGWEKTSTGFVRRAAVTQPTIITGYESRSTYNVAATANDDILVAQYVYALPPGVAFTTGDTVKGQMAARELEAADDLRAQMTIRVIAADGTVRATLLNFDTSSLASEFAVHPTVQNRKFPRGGAVSLAANYTTVDGDYLVMEYGARAHSATTVLGFLVFGVMGDADLPEDETTTTASSYNPWIEFSTDLSGPGYVTDVPAWTPPTPVKHFGVAVWPSGLVTIPEDAESRTSVEMTGDVTVHIAAEPLVITRIEAETEIYELATELRLRGGGNAVGPYETLLVGNARQLSGPGTPRAALKLRQRLDIDTERHTHALWTLPDYWDPSALAPWGRWDPNANAQADNTALASLADSAGSNRHLVQATGTNQPTIQTNEINGMKVARFDGTNDKLGVAGPTSNTITIAAVWKNSAPSQTLFVSDNSGSVRPKVAINGSTQVVANANAAGTSQAWSTGAYHVTVNAFDTAGGTLESALDGAHVTGSPGGNGFSGNIIVGADNTGAAGWLNGDLAYLMVFTSKLSTAEIQQVTGWLAWRFGLQGNLPALHPYKSAAPLVSTPIVMAEMLSAHTVRALEGRLRDVDATDIPALQRIAQTVPNNDFASNLTGWELHQDDADWTYAVTRDASVGGAAAGSQKIAVTVTDAGTILRRSTTYLPVSAGDSVEVTAWVRQSESGSSAPRLGVAWYDATPTLIQTDLDAFDAALLNPGDDHTLTFAGSPPAGATQYRVVLGVTATGDAPATKWFDDITATIVRPLRYDGSISKVTDEARSPRWLPLAPARRNVPNGDFAANITGWALESAGAGITYTAGHDAAVGGIANGALKIAISASSSTNSIIYRTSGFFAVNGAEQVEMSAWMRSSHANIRPHIGFLWYGDADDTLLAATYEPAWGTAPTANAEYERSFAAIVPAGMTRFRLALTAAPAISSATGDAWFDDIKLNDNDLLVADVSSPGLAVEALVQPRWTP